MNSHSSAQDPTEAALLAIKQALKSDDGSADLSTPIPQAYVTALSVLADHRRPTAARGEASRDHQTAAVDAKPVPDQSGEGHPEIQRRHITRRDEIPLDEVYVLVMWGMSTYKFTHPRGITFVVDNSRFNRERDHQYKEALTTALQIAQSQALKCIYLLS